MNKIQNLSILFFSLSLTLNLFALDDDSMENSEEENTADEIVVEESTNETDAASCFKGPNAPFGDKNVKLASDQLIHLNASEKKASDLHYERQYAVTAMRRAVNNNDKVDPQDVLLIKNCPDILDKDNPTYHQLDVCKEHLYDLMENQLAFRFTIVKEWEEKCESYKSLNCKEKVDKYFEDLPEDFEAEDNGVCAICDKLYIVLPECRKGE